uniref:Septin-2 n=1 Tax=Pundamilia nyererei TaxID=303518 RepID=A0A3B4ERF3_9CICH
MVIIILHSFLFTFPPFSLQQGQFSNPETPGYVGFANLPNQVHRKSVKKGFEFTLMVVGESGLGKSTLINSLFLTDLYPERVIPGAAEKIERTVQIEASTVEIEERGVKLQIIVGYIDDQFERYLHDESGLNRRHIVDNRVHCCFYFISPLGHGMKPLDVQFMKAIHNKVNVVPVIAKADTLTLRERERLKRRILDEIDEHGIKIYHLPDAESDEDEDFKEQTRILKASIPFAVVGSNQQIEAKGKKVRGRLYPWGVVEVENPEHNDFLKLRIMLITHMQDLQEVTQDLHYENFRSERLKRGGRLSSHGYILPMSPAYVLPCLLAFLHLPLLKQQISELCIHLHPVLWKKHTHTRGET